MEIGRSTRIIDRVTDALVDRDVVLAVIRTLSAAAAPPLDQVERTLADGYACALAIELEQSKLRRVLEESAAALGANPGAVGEVACLAQGIVRSTSELAELREALAGWRKPRAGSAPPEGALEEPGPRGQRGCVGRNIRAVRRMGGT